jgi:hypothetical protein
MRGNPTYLKMGFIGPIVATTISHTGKNYDKEIIKAS